MHVVNTGASCSIANFGLPAERAHPRPPSGAITGAGPSHGSAVFALLQARYTPAPGYVGEDEFAYEAFAQGVTGPAASSPGPGPGAGRRPRTWTPGRSFAAWSSASPTPRPASKTTSIASWPACISRWA